MPPLFTTYEGMALLIAAIIFIITLLLLITRVIGFWITLLLLTFSLGAGFLIGNFTVIREYIEGSKQKEIEKVEKNISLLNEKVEMLHRELDNSKEENEKPALPPENPPHESVPIENPAENTQSNE